MAAALEAGVTRLFRIGGAHAIAALAYGTATIPRVDKIVGPGNRYVAAAKALVAGDCAIDFYAGPTEIVIVAGAGRAGLDRRRPHRAGRARPRRARRSSSRGAARSPSASARAVARAAAGRDIVARVARARTARVIVTRDRRRGDGARQPHRARASRRRPRGADAAAARPPAPSSSARARRRPPATTRPARTTCCRRPAPRASAAA